MGYRYNDRTGNFDFDGEENDFSSQNEVYNDYDDSEPYFGDNVYDYSINKYHYKLRQRGANPQPKQSKPDYYDENGSIVITKVLKSIIDNIFK